MNIAVTITKKEFQSILFKYSLDTCFSYKRYLVPYLFFLLLSIQITEVEGHSLFMIWIVYPLCGLILYGLYLSNRYWFPLLKFLSVTDSVTSVATYTLTTQARGIQVKTKKGEKFIAWNKIISIKRLNEYLVINALDNSVYILPESLFEDQTSCDNFIQSVQKGIIKARGTLKVSMFLRPPYLLGLTCFIPVFGVYIGLAYILFGLFHYKDKLMVLMGSLGILFTFVYFGYTFPETWNKVEEDKLYQSYSQVTLNDLMKGVEYYKSKYGSYPVDLEQLSDSLRTFSIIDPSQEHFNKGEAYNYSLTENGYKLFSAGMDGLPHTSDDIYPEVKDMSKVGLTR